MKVTLATGLAIALALTGCGSKDTMDSRSGGSVGNAPVDTSSDEEAAGRTTQTSTAGGGGSADAKAAPSIPPASTPLPAGFAALSFTKQNGSTVTMDSYFKKKILIVLFSSVACGDTCTYIANANDIDIFLHDQLKKSECDFATVLGNGEIGPWFSKFSLPPALAFTKDTTLGYTGGSLNDFGSTMKIGKVSAPSIALFNRNFEALTKGAALPDDLTQLCGVKIPLPF